MFLTPSDIETLTGYAQFLDASRAPVLANRQIVCLSGVFKWAVRKGWTEVNPCLEVQKHSEPPRERYIEDHELERLLSAAGVCVFAHFPRIPVYIPI